MNWILPKCKQHVFEIIGYSEERRCSLLFIGKVTTYHLRCKNCGGMMDSTLIGHIPHISRNYSDKVIKEKDSKVNKKSNNTR